MNEPSETAMPIPLHVVPEHVRQSAATALAAAFPDGIVRSVAALHGGLSGSLVYTVNVGSQRAVLRIVQHTSPLSDPVREFACMRVAAEQGVAPQVYHANADTGVSVSAFVDTAQAPSTPRNMSQLGALVRRLHDGPAFPVFLSTFQLIDSGLEQLKSAGVTLPTTTREVLTEFAIVRTVLQPRLVMAPCHNDLNPGNVLQDGERQWLVDWEGACMNDPMFDVACTIQWFLLDAKREAELLLAYFGRTLNEQECAKLHLMKQVMRCFYMLVFQLISLGADGLGDLNGVEISTLPTFADFLHGVRRGEIRLQDVSARRHLSLVLAQQSLAVAREPMYHQALARMREGT